MDSRDDLAGSLDLTADCPTLQGMYSKWAVATATKHGVAQRSTCVQLGCMRLQALRLATATTP